MQGLRPIEILERYYDLQSPVGSILVRHSESVMRKALEIMNGSSYRDAMDEDFIRDAAMLHDIGVYQCNAPAIHCLGSEHYLRHGIIGAGLLRGLDRSLEPYALVCERHIGCGLSRAEILAGRLPLPPTDFLPQSAEEKLVCLADKFYSKSGDMREKNINDVRVSIARFGEQSLRRFDDMCRMFGVA